MNEVNIFLDDYGQPQDAFKYTRNECYLINKWVTVKNYDKFVKAIDYHTEMGIKIRLISFDHDLADAHYGNGPIDYDNVKEKTGFHCAKYVIDNCMNHGLALPAYLCHSMNPVGKENIISILDQYRRLQYPNKFT